MNLSQGCPPRHDCDFIDRRTTSYDHPRVARLGEDRVQNECIPRFIPSVNSQGDDPQTQSVFGAVVLSVITSLHPRLRHRPIDQHAELRTKVSGTWCGRFLGCGIVSCRRMLLSGFSSSSDLRAVLSFSTTCIRLLHSGRLRFLVTVAMWFLGRFVFCILSKDYNVLCSVRTCKS